MGMSSYIVIIETRDQSEDLPFRVLGWLSPFNLNAGIFHLHGQPRYCYSEFLDMNGFALLYLSIQQCIL